MKVFFACSWKLKCQSGKIWTPWMISKNRNHITTICVQNVSTKLGMHIIQESHKLRHTSLNLWVHLPLSGSHKPFQWFLKLTFSWMYLDFLERPSRNWSETLFTGSEGSLTRDWWPSGLVNKSPQWIQR